jgi:hypothetical protein
MWKDQAGGAIKKFAPLILDWGNGTNGFHDNVVREEKP